MNAVTALYWISEHAFALFMAAYGFHKHLGSQIMPMKLNDPSWGMAMF